MAARSYRPLFTTVPTDRQQRWRLVREFAQTWSEPIVDDDGYSEADIREAEKDLTFPFPAALREWYMLAGKRMNLWSCQDRLFGPHQVASIWNDPRGRYGNNLAFYIEAQGCECWAIRSGDTNRDDPPVVRLLDNPGEVAPTVSAFALQTLLREAMWSAPVCGQTELVDDPAGVLDPANSLLRCDLPDKYWAAGDPVRFYEAQDLIVLTYAEFWVYVAALNQEACDQLPREVLDKLEWRDP